MESLDNKKLDLRFKILFLFFGILGLFFLFFGISKSFLARGKEKIVPGLSFFAYEKDFRGGINVICGDVDENGKDEIITSPKNGGVSHIRIFDEKGKSINSFYAYPEKYNFGTNVALGDVDGDGKKEIITSPEINDSTIKIFKDQKPILEFQAWKNVKIGAAVASGDINSDGKDEIILGAGKGGGPQIKIYNHESKELSSFFAFHPRSREGVDIAASDVDQDGKSEIIISEKKGNPALIKIHKSDKINSLVSSFYAYPKNLKVGADIAVGDLGGDGKVEIVTASSLSGGTQIRGFKIDGEPLPINFFAFDNNFHGEADVAICNLDGVGKKEIVVGAGQGGSPQVRIFYKY